MKFTLTVFATLWVTLCFAQQKFEPGTITFANGNITECLIKHSYSSENPTSVKYKLSEEAEEKTALLKEIEGFQIGEKTKFIKATVNFDKSSNKVEELSTVRTPEYVEETALLEVLVEGTASLYRLEQNNIIKYFYKIEEGEITPLVYKRYLVNTFTIRENFEYIQQLNKEVNCDENHFISNKAVGYNSNDLTKLFKKFNRCENNILTFEEMEERAKIKLYAKAGYHFTSDKVQLQGSYNDINRTAKGSGFETGLQAEINLPFNYRKWSAIGELTYYGINYDFSDTSKQGFNSTVETKVNTVRVSVGVRHNFYLDSENSESNIIYLEALVTAFSFQAGKNSIVRTSDFSTGADDLIRTFELSTIPNISLGAGFPIYKNLSGNIRYNLPQEYLTKYLSHSYKISSFSVNLNYRFL
ncbi:MAG: hypothetical protein WCY89_10105 [Flavobacteriaceae bacterium]